MRRFADFIEGARSLAFVYLLALIMAVGSERVFWFWVPGVIAHVEVAAFYSIATAVGVALIRRYRVNSWWSLALVAPVVAYVVEGVITPVLYTAGPFVPFFPAWFTMWHGLMSFVVLAFVVRRLLLSEAFGHLTGLALGFGLFWGVWASVQRLPENASDAEMVSELGPLRILGPGEFAIYAAVFTAVLMASHALIGFVWPRSPGDVPSGVRRRTDYLLVGLVLVGVIVWTFVVPWALPMFTLYSWVQIAALRRYRSSRAADGGGSDVFVQFVGNVRIRALFPVTLVAPAAALSYALIWELDPSVAVLRIVMYSIIAVQALIGAAVAVLALVRAWRLGRRSGDGRITRPIPSWMVGN